MFLDFMFFRSKLDVSTTWLYSTIVTMKETDRRLGPFKPVDSGFNGPSLKTKGGDSCMVVVK